MFDKTTSVQLSLRWKNNNKQRPKANIPNPENVSPIHLGRLGQSDIPQNQHKLKY
jgi:hypothetical protein